MPPRRIGTSSTHPVCASSATRNVPTSALGYSPEGSRAITRSGLPPIAIRLQAQRPALGHPEMDGTRRGAAVP